VRVGCAYPKTVVVCALIAVIAGGVTASTVRLDTDILSLVPVSNDVVRDFRTTIERFGTVDTLLVVVRLEPDQRLEPVVAYSETFARILREWELVDWVEYRLENAVDAAMPLLDRATLFLDPAAIDDLIRRVTDQDALDHDMERLRAELLAPQSVVTKRLLSVDPMGLLPRVLERIGLGGIGIKVDPETRCLIDPGRRFLLMIAKPVRPAQDLRFDRELASGLRVRLEEAAAEWWEEGWEGEPPAVTFTGGYAIALEDTRTITRDAVVGLASSLIGVGVLFLLAFRRPASVSYALVPLLVGLSLTVIFMVAVLGRLNSLTAASGGLLVGLGIDFVIVLYGRYVEERENGVAHRDAIDAVGRHTGVSVMLGGVTTAATFYAFLVTDFAGLFELGLITGTGILLLMVSVFLLLPALLTLFYGSGEELPKLSLRSFGSDRLCRLSLRHPGWTLALGAAATVVLGIGVTRLEFDDDMRNLRSGNDAGSQLRDEVMEAFGLRFSPMTIRIDGIDEESVFDTARRLMPRLAALVDGENLLSVDTIADVIPPVASQLEVIARLDAAAGRLNGVEQRMERGLRNAGLNPAAFADGIAHLGRALSVRRPFTLGDLEGTTLERAAARYIARHDDGVSLAIYCYPPAGRWRMGGSQALLDTVSAFPNATLTGPNIVSAELRRIVWGDAARAALVGLVAVFLLMWADLGSPGRSLMVLMPLALGVLWMLGVMAWLGLRVNFINIFVLTMIIGIGVDYGLHLLHRWMETGGRQAEISETAKAIAVAALTTVVGFGSLVTSHFPGLRSVGAAAILGALFTAVTSITVLPVVLQRIDRRRRAAGASAGANRHSSVYGMQDEVDNGA